MADDDEPIRRLICVNLELEGFDVDVATDGLDCLTLALADPPDLITLDLVMPGLDGLATATRLRADARTRHVPILLLSGAATSRDKSLAEKIGVDGFVTKPFAPDVLIATVRRLAEAARLTH